MSTQENFKNSINYKTVLRKILVQKEETSYLYRWSINLFLELLIFLSSFLFSSQIETIDDPVPAVEAILRRCNKHQVNNTGI